MFKKESVYVSKEKLRKREREKECGPHPKGNQTDILELTCAVTQEVKRRCCRGTKRGKILPIKCRRSRYAREQLIHRIASNQLLEVLKIKLNEANTTLPCQDSTVRAALTLALL